MPSEIISNITSYHLNIFSMRYNTTHKMKKIVNATAGTKNTK